jgi:uncharacterized protein (DUF488 family)
LSSDGGRIYSIGYEDMSLAGLVECLSQSRVSVLVDVRLNPSSRRPGFSRRPLAQALADVGIDYVHEPLLGNPADNRDGFRRGDAEAWGRVEQRLVNEGSEALDRLVTRARGQRVAVLCVERDGARCHRRAITNRARALAPELDVVEVH